MLQPIVFTLHDEFFPLTYAFTWQASTSEDVAHSERRLDLMHERNQKMVQIFDLRDSSLPNAKIRREMADMSNRFEKRVKQNVIISVIVLNSKIAAGGMTALRWATGGWLNMRVCANANSALALCREAGPEIQFPSEASLFCKRVDAAVKAKKNLNEIRRLGPNAPVDLFPKQY